MYRQNAKFKALTGHILLNFVPHEPLNCHSLQLCVLLPLQKDNKA